MLADLDTLAEADCEMSIPAWLLGKSEIFLILSAVPPILF